MTRLSLSRVTGSVLRRLARRTRMYIWWAPAIDEPYPSRGEYALTRIRPAQVSAADRDLAEEAMRMAGEPDGLVSARLAHGDEMFGWLWEGRIVSFCWVTFHDRSIGPVRLADSPGRVFVYNAITSEPHRGRGLFAALLLAMRSALGREGATEFLGDVHERNAPSARSCEKAGFAPVGSLAFLTIFNTWQWPMQRTVSSDRAGQIF
jgi:RimJ/RimL family protein N-acetyltransferase